MNLQDQADSRLIALKASQLLDSPPEEIFDRLTALLTKALGVPVALISLVDEKRQFFKSAVGLPAPYCDLRETPLTHSFCQHVVAVNEPLVVSDAREHPLLRTNLAIPDLGVVAYAGVPLTDKDGNCLGSLCAIDGKPRNWTVGEIDLLKAIALQIMSELEIRASVRHLARNLSEMQVREVDRRAANRHTVHDLRTPLNSLLMSLEVLATLDPSAEQAEWTNVARTSGKALQVLVDDLIDEEAIAQKGRGALTLSETSPYVTAGSALDQIRGALHSKQLKLTREFAQNLPDMWIDGQKITRVLVNLLGNATKFTPEGGEIKLSIQQRGTDALAFIVTDDGIGFDQALADKIFDSGVTLDDNARSRISTGWGLEFCKRTVEAHRGKIEVASTVNDGSTFTVILPIRG